MVEYKKIFSNKMKSLLTYLVKFSRDYSIVINKYSYNSVVIRPDLRLIIMIIYIRSIFSSNDSFQKYELLMVKMFYDQKEKKT